MTPTPAKTPNPGTPKFPPEQVAALTLGGLGIVSQFVPITEEAKQGVVTITTIVAPTIAVAGAAVRVGRQKWWQNFMRIDADHDPSTPPTLLPIPYLIALGVTAAVAIGFMVAFFICLLT